MVAVKKFSDNKSSTYTYASDFFFFNIIILDIYFCIAVAGKLDLVVIMNNEY